MFDWNSVLYETNLNPFYSVVRNQLLTPFLFEGEEEPRDVYVERDALLNGEKGTVLGTVGSRYKLITNQEVFDVFGEAFEGLPIESVIDHLNWKENRWQRDFILNGDQFNIDVGGQMVKTKVSIFNGYDGKSSVGFSISAYLGDNGITYLNNVFTQNYTHVQRDLVDRIREDFSTKIRQFQDTAEVFRRFDQEQFTPVQFESFVNGLVREENVNGFLSERQAQAIIDSYHVQFTRLGVRPTRFGTYTVLSAIATENSGRGGSSPIFTAGFKRMEKVVQNFFADAPEDLFTI